MQSQLLNLFLDDTVVFFGAGISLNSGIPVVYGNSYNTGIVDQIINEFDIQDNEKKILFNSKMPFEAFINNLRIGSRIDNFLTDIFSFGSPNHTHQFMAECAKAGLIKTFVTTNFDELLELSLQKLSIPYVLYKNDEDFRSIDWDTETVKIIKLHGTISHKKSIDITINNVSLKINSIYFKNIIEKIFRSGNHKNILILGYSCSDVFDISPLISSFSDNNNKQIHFIEHVAEQRELEEISNKDLKNPFKNYKGKRYFLNTDEFIIQISNHLKYENIKINTVQNNKWKEAIFKWSFADTFDKNTILSKMFFDISELDLAEKYSLESIREEDRSEVSVTKLSNLITILVSRSKYKDAEFFAIKAQSFNENSKESPSLYLNISELYSHLGNETKRIKALLKAEKLINLRKDYRLESQCLEGRIAANLSSSYFECNDIENSRIHIEKSWSLYEKTGDIYCKIIIYKTLSKIYNFQGRFDDAMHHINIAIDLSHELGTPLLKASAMLEKANYYDQSHDYSSSLQTLLDVCDIAIKFNLVKIEAISKGNIANIYIRMNKNSEARENLNFAIEHSTGLLKITYIINLGFLENENFEYKKATDLFKNAIELIENNDSSAYLGELRRAYLNMSNSYINLKQYTSALFFAKSSKDLAIKLNNVDGIIRAGNNIGIAFANLGELNQGKKELDHIYKIAKSHYGSDNPITESTLRCIHHYFNKKYSFYIEDCQLCIQRNNFNNCGWCNDKETSGGEGRVKIDFLIAEDYPFHSKAHKSRKYFTDDNLHIEELDGMNI